MSVRNERQNRRHRLSAFDDFVETIATLRGENGCPWDREQTHRSIASSMIEEAYEAVDAIESGSSEHLCEELGDVLLQVVLQSQIAFDNKEFSIEDVCRGINEKMIRRHPHVFGKQKARDSSEVLNLWEQVKLAEKKAEDIADALAGTTKPAGLLESVPESFPALLQAQKISRAAAAAGFEWKRLDDVWEQVSEEIAELKEAYAACSLSEDGKILKSGSKGTEDADALFAAEAAEIEFGDVLFALVNVARRMGINAESALRGSCKKFRHRWESMEKEANLGGKRIEELSRVEQEQLWDQAKSAERRED